MEKPKMEHKWTLERSSGETSITTSYVLLRLMSDCRGKKYYDVVDSGNENAELYDWNVFHAYKYNKLLYLSAETVVGLLYWNRLNCSHEYHIKKPQNTPNISGRPVGRAVL